MDVLFTKIQRISHHYSHVELEISQDFWLFLLTPQITWVAKEKALTLKYELL
jgi:hypothetical protein